MSLFERAVAMQAGTWTTSWLARGCSGAHVPSFVRVAALSEIQVYDDGRHRLTFVSQIQPGPHPDV